MKYTKEKDVDTFELDNPLELVEYCEKAEDYLNIKQEVSGGFHEKSFTESLKDFKKGNIQKSKEFNLSLDKLKSMNVEYKYNKIDYDVTGDCLDVGTFLAGKPECFSVLSQEAKKVKNVINIYINLAVPYNVKIENIKNRSLLIVDMIDKLSRDNVINLICEIHVNRKHKSYTRLKKRISLKINMPVNPLSINDFITVFSNDYLRRFFICFFYDFYKFKKHDNAGAACDNPDSKNIKSDIYISKGNISKYDSISSGLKFVNSVLNNTAKKVKVL